MIKKNGRINLTVEIFLSEEIRVNFQLKDFIIVILFQYSSCVQIEYWSNLVLIKCLFSK